jgi:hypothetical protein
MLPSVLESQSQYFLLVHVYHLTVRTSSALEELASQFNSRERTHYMHNNNSRASLIPLFFHDHTQVVSNLNIVNNSYSRWIINKLPAADKHKRTKLIIQQRIYS